jgi:hypothetical protein
MQVGLAMEDDVGGILDLHDAPMVGTAELAGDRAVAGGEAVQGMVEALDGKAVGQGLRFGEVRNAGEGVVQLREGDAGLTELAGQVVVAVAVELETEGRPSGHAEIAQPELGVEEVEVVVEALPVLVAQGRPPTGLVIPGGEGWAGLHGREDVDQARAFPPLAQDRPNAIFLAEAVDRTDELDLYAVLLGDPFGVTSDLLPQRLGEAGVVEEADPMLPQVVGHAFCKANAREGTRDDDAIKAGEDASDLGRVTFRQQRHTSTLLSRPSAVRGRSSVFKNTSFLVSALPS